MSERGLMARKHQDFLGPSSLPFYPGWHFDGVGAVRRLDFSLEKSNWHFSQGQAPLEQNASGSLFPSPIRSAHLLERALV